MKNVLFAIGLLLLLPQNILAQDFKDINRVVLRGLSPSTKYVVSYQQRVVVWQRFRVDRCGTIEIKRSKSSNFWTTQNYEFRADDEEKSITPVFISSAQSNAAKSAINWDSKESERLGYKCTNAEIMPNLDPYWVNATNGIRFHYRGDPYNQSAKMYITGIDSSNVHIRSLTAPDNGPNMRRTMKTDRCGQLIIRHNDKYPASALGGFVVSPSGPGWQPGNYYNLNSISDTPTSTRCAAPFAIIP